MSKYAVVFEVPVPCPPVLRDRVNLTAERALRRAGVEGEIEYGIAGQIEGYVPEPGRELFMAMGYAP